MESKSQCPFYRRSGSPGMHYRDGYCEFDCTYSICDGESKHCGKLNVLRRHLMERSWMQEMIKGKKTARH